ncbi:PAS domain-containing sensor histidine kinase [Alicyclobacillus contaminans]|uniref:PAS domain-containing sensor histidine kinase n=1 Tax=Alicyclobacillus contaminans TaxID=392016 RepID=UPI00146F96A0|nr:ATP-binding protein [Alicyclobacillus contaminans]
MQTLYLPVLIFSAVLTRALTLSGWDLYFEVSCDLFFLAVIYIFSVQYRNLANRYRESEKKYRLIAENTLDVILTLDTDGRVTYASPSHETVMGWSGDALVGTPLTSVVHPDDRVSVQDHLRMAREQLTPFQIQFNYRRDTAGWVLVEGAGSPMLDTEGDMDGLVLVLRDITDRVETEELLRKSDKLAVVGQLAAGVAHELRNPLTAVKGFLQLLKRRQASESEYIGIMLDELKRIELIIGEFLILAKPHAVQFQRKNPEALLQSVVALLDAQAILNNVQIRIEADRPLPDVLCEENQLKQVFINILKNAIEAMPHGGDIDIQAVTTPTGEVVLRFIDHGVGIAESHLPRLGEPFYTTKESGTGLGLMISYRIVQAHKGQMSIQSQLHQGTTVEIRLPGVS